MGSLFFKDGRAQCPPCPVCGSKITTEDQEPVQEGPEASKNRVRFLRCMSCQHEQRLGTFRNLGGHSFQRIRD